MAACGSCSPAANFPNPHLRSGSGGEPNPNRKPEPRRRTYYSRHLERISFILQEPSSISLREFAIAVFVCFALYRLLGPLGQLHYALARRDVGRVCSGLTAMQCLNFHLLLCFWTGFGWAADVLPWAIAYVVVVFLAEELLRAVKRR